MSNKKWKVTLTPLTPIHIGDGEMMDPTEYIAKDGYVYYLNQIAFMSHLLSSGKNTLKQALDSSNMESIIRIMADNFDADNKLHWKSRTKVDANFCNLWKQNLKNVRNSQQLHRFIRNQANDQPYIPGSSIKGAIRTAILDELAEDKDKRQEIEQARRDRKFNAQTAEAILLNAKNQRGTMDISSDPFKYLKVSDAIFQDDNLFIDTIQRYGMAEKDLPVYYEMINFEKGSFCFDMEAGVKIMDIAVCPINRLQLFSTSLINKEIEWMKNHDKERFTEFYRSMIKKTDEANKTDDQCLIRLGFGSGHWSMTLQNYWKDDLKTKAVWNEQLLGWAHLQFEEIT